MKIIILKCSFYPRSREQRLVVGLTILILFFASMVSSVFAQSGAAAGRRHASFDARMYQLNTVETVSGEVISVDSVPQGKRRSVGIHCRLQTKKELLSVHLGPAWYLRTQKISIRSKDKISVKGSKIVFDGQPALIAAVVIKGKDSLLLRNANGIPLWRGRGSRNLR